MAKKKEDRQTIKSQLDQLDRELAQEVQVQPPVQDDMRSYLMNRMSRNGSGDYNFGYDAHKPGSMYENGGYSGNAYEPDMEAGRYINEARSGKMDEGAYASRVDESAKSNGFLGYLANNGVNYGNLAGMSDNDLASRYYDYAMSVAGEDEMRRRYREMRDFDDEAALFRQYGAGGGKGDIDSEDFSRYMKANSPDLYGRRRGGTLAEDSAGAPAPADERSVAELARARYAAPEKPDLGKYAEPTSEKEVAEAPLPSVRVSPSFDAAYDAERARIDAAIADGPLFAGQKGPGTVMPDEYTGRVGENVTRQVMQQGVNPPAGQAPVAPAQEAAIPAGVGTKAAEEIYRQGVNPDRYAGQTGGNVTRQVMEQGLYPEMAQAPQKGQEEAGQGPAPAIKGNWDDFLDPYLARQKEYEAELQQLLQMDAEMQRREDARKRIVALGDAFSSFANLIGTAHGAENQRQTYASPLLDESVENARKLRVGRMQRIRKNIDEQRDMILQLQMNNDPNYLPNQIKMQSAANSARQLDLRERELGQREQHQANQDQLNQDKFAYQQDKDAGTAALNQRKQDWKEHVDQTKLNQAAQRIRLSNEKFEEQKARHGGGGGGGSTKDWSDEALENFNSFKEEVARRAGCSNWQQFSDQAEYDRDLRDFARNVEEAASSPTKQRGVLNHYAKEFAPEYFNKYHQGDTRANGRKPNPMGPAEKAKKPNPMN